MKAERLRNLIKSLDALKIGYSKDFFLFQSKHGKSLLLKIKFLKFFGGMKVITLISLTKGKFMMYNN